jgi:hypothetical protein
MLRDAQVSSIYGRSVVGMFSATTTLARKTSAATAFLLAALPEFAFEQGWEADLMDSFRRFTDERDMSRRGLSLDRRMGVGYGCGEEAAWGNEPGMLGLCF